MSSVRLVIIAIAITSCSKGSKAPPLADVIKEHGPAAEKVVAAAEQMAKALPPAPAMEKIVKAGMAPNTGTSSDGIKLDGPPLTLTHWFGGYEMPKKIGNTTLIHAKGLGDLTKQTYGDVDITTSTLVDVLTTCASLVRKQAMPNSGDDEGNATKYLKVCGQLKYVLVLRTVFVSKPTEDVKAKTFSPGQLGGELLIFGLTSGKFLGSFLISIGQQATTVRKGGAVSGFQMELESALSDGLKKYAGATL